MRFWIISADPRAGGPRDAEAAMSTVARQRTPHAGRSSVSAAPGSSCARYLRARGWRIAVTDTRDGAAASCARLARARCRDPGAPRRRSSAPARRTRCCVVVSPGVSLAEPFFAAARRAGFEIVGDIELLRARRDAPVVGITGTNGKSTVTTLVGLMAERAGLQRAGRRQPRRAGARSARCSRHRALRARAVELPARDHRVAAAAARRRCSTSRRITSIATPTLARLRGRQGAHLRALRHAVVNLDDPLVVAMPRAAARTLSFSLRAAIGADYARGRHDGELVAHARAASRCCRWRQLKITGPAQRRERAGGARARRGARHCRSAAMLEELRELRRSAAPLAVGRRRRRRALHRRLEGHERRRDAGGGRRHGGPAGADRRRGRQEPGLRAARAAFRGKVRHAVLIGRDAAALEQRSRACARSSAPRRCRRRCARRGARPRSPATPCCSRPRARASTCSATTPIAARCSRKRCGSWRA